jgi:hypothetical protein
MQRERRLEICRPGYRWREPVTAFPPALVGDHRVPGFGCRYCIAMYGIRGEGSPDLHAAHPERLTHMSKLPKTKEEFEAHLRAVHHR